MVQEEHRNKSDADFMDLVADAICARLSKRKPYSTIISITPEPMHHRVMGFLSLPARGDYWAFVKWRDLYLDGYLRDALELALFYQAECAAGRIEEGYLEDSTPFISKLLISAD
ncbi:hypothetical protein N7461_000899 [Penicillium sp. DV-2018c]|nr:hypothetical protein N7461_000899 [Penicillium sp. DV-2018c]